ncbi:RNA polymerase, sigma-24 subunit, ECF subfamily [Candidatus Sulfopaludibacter sp. SbA4]|nr:RNA polymerase, sigma-24 subunit, ECF subfamily [Candidatus Sulfopaludibacter sp. SbA4]
MSPSAHGEITLLLNRVSAGEQEEYNRLAELVYAELRKIASHVMVAESRDHTLQPTMMATEAYFKLVDQGSHNWQNRAHFFAVAAQAMRRIMVDYGRKRRSLKRGGTSRRVELDEAANVALDSHEDVLALDEALTRLGAIDKRQSQIVELRYFSGLTEEETAAALGIGLRTVKREWAVARAWLHAELTRGPG